MRLQGHGLTAELPAGWEGAISLDRDEEAVELAGIGGTLHPVVHLGSFPLPADRGDFGSGAVEVMRDDDMFVALVEYGPDAVGTPLFATGGLPRRVDPRWFSGASLQRAVPGQVGWQSFFTQGNRAFCLYVVLGAQGDANQLARRVEAVLATIEIEEAR